MTTWYNLKKGGSGYQYDDPLLTYDEATDPQTGNVVHYDAVGTQPVWTTINKS